MTILNRKQNGVRSAWATLALAAAALTIMGGKIAEAAPVNWSFQNMTTNAGMTINGSFAFDATTGAYSNIAVETVGPNGTIQYAATTTGNTSGGFFLHLIEEALPDLTAKPVLLLRFATPLTAAGGVIAVTPFPSGESYQATCSNAPCNMFAGPFADITGGQVTTAQVWHIEGVTTASGKTLSGTYRYDAFANQFSNYQLSVTGDGPPVQFTAVNPSSSGSSTILGAVGQIVPDLFGQPDLFAQLAAAMTAAGGSIDVLPGPASFSFIGFCGTSNCSASAGPFDYLAAGGRVTTSALSPQITNSLTVMVQENQTLAVDVDAQDDNDSEGSGLSYTLTGGADQALFSIDASTGVVSFNTAPSFLAPTDANQDNSYEVQVTVTDLGNRTGTADFVIQVIGTPDITATPGSLNFGDVPLFGAPIDLDFQIDNVGTADLTIYSVALDINDGFFFEVTDAASCTGALAPLSRCSMTLRYASRPDNPVGPLQATLTVISNDPDQPAIEIPVSANVILGTVQIPSSLDIGSVPTGSTATRTVPVNIDGPVLLEAVFMDDPDGHFTITNNCAVGVLLTESCSIEVSFSPVDIGARSAPLNVEVGGPNTLFMSVQISAQGVAPMDSDGDGVQDFNDNCTLVANANQRDTNGDGFGNLCDPDLDDNGTVNVVDLGVLRSVFFSDNANADFNGDGVVNITDLGVLRSYFFSAPGPAGLLSP